MDAFEFVVCHTNAYQTSQSPCDRLRTARVTIRTSIQRGEAPSAELNVVGWLSD